MAILAGMEVRGEGGRLWGGPLSLLHPAEICQSHLSCAGCAYKSSAPPVPPPAGDCRLFRFVILLLSWELKKKKKKEKEL